MGVLVFWKLRTEFTAAGDQRAGHAVTPFGLAVGLLESANNQSPNRGSRALCSVAQFVVQRLRNINSGSDSHNMIMS
ncbi:MAG: hypothetical protein DMG57_35395 [Acidobacteria bacterium]|nr:MAG: hypothetical protein DMG57_35395 [Acidobacteriota bacterium]